MEKHRHRREVARHVRRAAATSLSPPPSIAASASTSGRGSFTLLSPRGTSAVSPRHHRPDSDAVTTTTTTTLTVTTTTTSAESDDDNDDDDETDEFFSLDADTTAMLLEMSISRMCHFGVELVRRSAAAADVRVC